MDWKTSSTILERLHNQEDQEVWRDLVYHFRGPILRLAERMSLPSADAEDAAQETLIAFANSYRANTYDRSRGRLRDWLFGIAHFKIRELRKKRVRGARPGVLSVAGNSDATTDEVSVSEIESVPATEECQQWWQVEWERNIYERCLERVRGEVAVRTLEIFRLLVSEGCSVEQVCTKLDVTPTIVYQARNRVSKRITELAARFQDC